MPRYQVNWYAKLSGQDSLIKQFSEEGVFLESKNPLSIGEKLHLEFTFENKPFATEVQVVNRTMTAGGLYGLQFNFKDTKTRLMLKYWSFLLDLKGTERRPEKVPYFKQITDFFKKPA